MRKIIMLSAIFLLSFLDSLDFVRAEYVASLHCYRYFQVQSVDEFLQVQQRTMMQKFFPMKGPKTFSGKELSFYLNITHPAVSFLVNGKTALSQYYIVALSRLLKISVWDLVGYISDYRQPLQQVAIPRGIYSDIANDKSLHFSDRLKTAQVQHLQILLKNMGIRIKKKELARHIDVNNSALSHYFSGRTLLSLKSAVLIAEFLDVDPRVVLAYLQDFDGLNP